MNLGPVVVAAVCAVVYYRLGEIEYGRGFLLGAISVLVSCVTSLLLGWSGLASILAQMGIFVVMTIVNMLRKGFR